MVNYLRNIDVQAGQLKPPFAAHMKLSSSRSVSRYSSMVKKLLLYHFREKMQSHETGNFVILGSLVEEYRSAGLVEVINDLILLFEGSVVSPMVKLLVPEFGIAIRAIQGGCLVPKQT